MDRPRSPRGKMETRKQPETKRQTPTHKGHISKNQKKTGKQTNRVDAPPNKEPMIGFIYIFTASPFLFKIGVSKNPAKRRDRVSRDVTPVRILFTLPLFFPYFFEALFHKAFAATNTKKKGNGGTEFFADIFFAQQIIASIILSMIFIGQLKIIKFAITWTFENL